MADGIDGAAMLERQRSDNSRVLGVGFRRAADLGDMVGEHRQQIADIVELAQLVGGIGRPDIDRNTLLLRCIST